MRMDMEIAIGKNDQQKQHRTTAWFLNLAFLFLRIAVGVSGYNQVKSSERWSKPENT